MSKKAAIFGLAAGLTAIGWFLLKTEAGKGIIETITYTSKIDSTMTFANETTAVSKDVDVMARTLYGEARNEGQQGMIAIANVIMNRVNKSKWNPIAIARFGRGVQGVCQKKWQFSCWLPMFSTWMKSSAATTSSGKNIIANYNKMMSASTKDTQFNTALDIATKAISGKLADITGGATYYHANYVTPDWANGVKTSAVVGTHKFYTFESIA